MPALTPAQLYQFEDRYYDVLTLALGALCGTPCFPAHAQGDLPSTRVVIELGAFGLASTHMAFAVDGTPFHDHYKGQISVIITTPRTPEGDGQRRILLGKIRDLFRNPRTLFASAAGVLPYALIKCEETNGQLTYIRDHETDRTEITYEVEHGIPGTLLPTADTPLTLPLPA